MAYSTIYSKQSSWTSPYFKAILITSLGYSPTFPETNIARLRSLKLREKPSSLNTLKRNYTDDILFYYHSLPPKLP